MHFSNFIYLFVKYWKIESVEAIAADYGFDDRHWNNENKRCWTKSVKQDNWPRPKSFEFALKIFWGQGRRKIRLRKILRAHNLSRKELKVALRSCGSHKHIILGVPKDSPRIMHTLGDYKGPATRAWPRAPGLSLESHNWTNTTTQCLDTDREFEMHFRFFLLFEFDFDLSGVWAGGRGLGWRGARDCSPPYCQSRPLALILTFIMPLISVQIHVQQNWHIIAVVQRSRGISIFNSTNCIYPTVVPKYYCEQSRGEGERAAAVLEKYNSYL